MIVRCPRCNTRIIQKSGDGKVRVRVNLLAFSQRGTEAICKVCGDAVSVDIELGQELRKSLDQQGPRLVVRKGVDTPDSGP